MAVLRISTQQHTDTIVLQPGRSVAELLLAAGYDMPYTCGGNGTCGKCRIRVAGEWQQACRLYPAEDITITEFGWEEAAKMHIVGAPLHREETGDDVNAEQNPTYVSMASSCIMTVDIGTTTLAAALVDKESGEVLSTQSRVNSQRKYGADVLSRIRASVSGEKKNMQNCIQEDVRSMISAFSPEWDGCTIEHIYIAGNTTMEHLYMGDSCETLGHAPFEPVSLAERQSVLDGIPVTLLPGISAFVGADITAGLLECGFDEIEKPMLFLDIGTNGEMALGTKKGILTTSAPAGPALEGANISCGVGSIDGAVAKVRMIRERNIVSTIGNKPPVGLCGTGVLETVSELLDNKWLDETGRMHESYAEDGYELAKTKDGNPILFTQQDVREVQMAKAAIRSGIDILLDKMNVTAEEIDKVYLAGGFGTYLDVEKAVRIGLLPKGLKKCTQAVGNTSLLGCNRYALHEAARDKVQKIIVLTEEMNLADEPDFEEKYIQYMNFPIA